MCKLYRRYGVDTRDSQTTALWEVILIREVRELDHQSFTRTSFGQTTAIPLHRPRTLYRCLHRGCGPRECCRTFRLVSTATKELPEQRGAPFRRSHHRSSVAGCLHVVRNGYESVRRASFLSHILFRKRHEHQLIF